MSEGAKCVEARVRRRVGKVRSFIQIRGKAVQIISHENGSYQYLSLHVPGSDSSALITKKDGRPSLFLGMKDHFKPEGNPAPPLPRRPMV